MRTAKLILLVALGAAVTSVQAAETASAKAPAAVNDAFQRELSGLLAKEKHLPLAVLDWSRKIARGEFAQAGHLLSVVDDQIPDKLEPLLNVSEVYLYWKLELNRSFLHQWLQVEAASHTVKTPGLAALDSMVEPEFEAWLIKNPISLSTSETALLARLPNKGIALRLKAWQARRDAKQARAMLKLLPANSALRPYLAQAVFALELRDEDLAAAELTLRADFDPVITKTPEWQALTQQAWGRLDYQKGDYEASRDHYLRIPNTAANYVQAHEELAWVYLRLHDSGALRGEVIALTAPALSGIFLPEAYAVRAISDIKMCFFDKVEQDFKEFSSLGSQWAKRIDQARANSTPPVPPQPIDTATRLLQTEHQRLDGEQVALRGLASESVLASAPAVGRQKHWLKLAAAVQAAEGEVDKRLAGEYRRAWNNMAAQMTEAIRKMRFVKVEYLSQLRDMQKDGTRLASNGPGVPASALINEKDRDTTFPVDGEIWPDELFKLRSTAQARCLKRGSQ